MGASLIGDVYFRMPIYLSSGKQRVNMQARGLLSRITESRGDPSKVRHSRSAPDTEPSNAGLPLFRVEGPSISDTECLDPTLRPGASLRPLRAAGRQHGCYPPVA